MSEESMPRIDLTKGDTTADTSATEDSMDTQTFPTTQPVPTAPAAPTAGSAPDAPAPWEPAEPRGVRVGTVVWGLVVAAIGLGLLAYAIGVAFDVQLAVIVLVAAAGVALLVGSLVTSTRRRNRAGWQR
ncbi:MAG TPA: hypothetical protein VGK35_01630 [Actinotalea sp.]|jgi:hypothetical protein